MTISYQEIKNKYGYKSEEELKDKNQDLYIYLDFHKAGSANVENDRDCWAVKFGDTEEENTIWDRYKKITGHTAYQRIFYTWDSELTDKQIHKVLKEKFRWCGEKDDPKNPFNTDEAYYVETLEDVEKIIEEIERHVKTHGQELDLAIFEEYQNKHFKNKFSCRQEQQDFVDKFVAYYYAKNRAERRFLLYAVCRFGKTATTLYTMIEKLHLKHILILSSKCDTNDSWKTDFQKWDFCKDYIYVDKYAIQNCPDLLKKNNIIAWCSFQSAAKDFETFNENGEEIETDELEEKWQKQVAEAEWDIIITDECHFGVDTKRSSSLINKILKNEDTFLLEISATPFKKINRGDYTNNNIYAYTLIDEWNEHHNDPDYVPVNLYHLNILNGLEMFKASLAKKTVLYNGVQTKIDNCYDEGKFSWRAYFSQFKPAELSDEFDILYNNYYSKTGQHCLIYVNRVSDGNKLAKALDKDTYEVINVCGNNKISLNAINKKMEGSKPVIIVSCGRYMTGVTMKLLTNVIFMGKVNSAEMYIQYGLRGKNKYEGRNGLPCAIYDLNTEVYVYSDPFKVMVSTEAKSKNLPLKNVVKNYEDALAIFEINDCNVFEEYKNFATKFTETFAHIDGDEEIPFCSFEMNDNVMSKLEDLLTNKIEKNKKTSLEITEQQIENAAEIDDGNSNKKKGRKKLTKEDKQKLKKIYELRDKFREQIKYIPTFMKFNNIENVEDIFTEENTNLLKIWHNVNVELFKTLREILSVNDWIEMCENIKAIKNKLPDDDMSWKYRGELPAWF